MKIRRLKDIRFRSSIYGQVVITITLLSIFLFVSFGLIFRIINERYLNTIIQQNGNNISSIVEGALYHSMLKNDKEALQSTLEVINTLPGIEDVSMYDSDFNLAYSPALIEEQKHNNPNCKECHANITSMFPGDKKSFTIVNMESNCEMSQKDYNFRLLLIRTPIQNEKSCYTSSCHVHNQAETVLGSFIIRIPLEDLDSAIHRSSSSFLFLAALTTFFLVISLIFFTRKNILSPLTAIIKASEAVTKGDRSTRLKMKTNYLTDIKMVSQAFNEMLDSLQSATTELQNWSQQLEYKVQKKSEELTEIQNELIHVERIASLGKLSSSVAHEINNPLSGILTYTKLIQKQLNKITLGEELKKPMLKYLKVIEDETKRCGEIVKGLLDFSRKDQQDFKPTNMHKLLREVYTLMDHRMKISSITFITDFTAEKDLINCSDNQIKQACIAILLNASEAVFENGEIIMRTTNPDPDHIKLDISDNGVGIDPDDLPHIFEPFFSAKLKASGIGLGLAIVYGIIQSHKGRIDVASGLGKGTTISFVLPLFKG